MTHVRPGRRARQRRQQAAVGRTAAGKLLTEIYTGGERHGDSEGRTKKDSPQGDAKANRRRG